MTHYLVTRCLRRGTPHRAFPYSIGDIELRTAESDTEHESEAVARSLTAHSEPAVQPDLFAVRVSTIVDADGPNDAFVRAAPRIDEALDVLALTNPMSAFSAYRLMDAGCARDLATGRVTPRLPQSDPNSNALGSVFLAEEYRWPPRDLAQYVVSTERGELGERYVRAAHWARKAELESNPHMAMLFEWFAAESIWNLKRDYDVLPPIRWSLGFPNGRGLQLLAPATVRALDSDALHRAWSKQVEDRLTRIRAIRNSTVHNGFRLIDVPLVEIRRLRVLANLAARYALHCVVQGIYARIPSIEDLVEQLPILLEQDLHATSKHVIERLLAAVVTS